MVTRLTTPSHLPQICLRGLEWPYHA